jgi:butyrate kinase
MLDKHLEREHVTNIGAPLAARLAQKLNIPAYMINPTVISEFLPGEEVNEYAPLALQSRAQVLCIREAAKRAAEALGRPMGEISLIAVHIGVGVTAAYLKKGNIIDIDQIPELKELHEVVSCNSELRMDVIEVSIGSGEKHACQVFDLLIDRVVKRIVVLYAAHGTDIEAIVLTGGLVKNALVRDSLRRRISPLAPILVFEGSLEMEALAFGAVRVLSGEDKPKRYKKR